jgi:hypothetical protein
MRRRMKLAGWLRMNGEKNLGGLLVGRGTAKMSWILRVEA